MVFQDMVREQQLPLNTSPFCVISRAFAAEKER